MRGYGELVRGKSRNGKRALFTSRKGGVPIPEKRRIRLPHRKRGSKNEYPFTKNKKRELSAIDEVTKEKSRHGRSPFYLHGRRSEKTNIASRLAAEKKEGEWGGGRS